MRTSNEILDEIKSGQVDEISRLVIYMLNDGTVEDWRDSARESLNSTRIRENSED